VKVTRSAFLAACGAGLLGAVIDARVLDGATVDATSGVRPAALDDLRSQVGSTFQLEATDGSQPVILAEVRDRSVEWRVEQSSALFRGDSAAALRDGIYAFHHPSLGRLHLFVVALGPAGMHAPHVYYEACISRFRSLEERHGH
jgi:hypothetical protein